LTAETVKSKRLLQTSRKRALRKPRGTPCDKEFTVDLFTIALRISQRRALHEPKKSCGTLLS
jgi:hypothetical protein